MCAMSITDKGWPLGQAAIEARYHELIKKETDFTISCEINKAVASTSKKIAPDGRPVAHFPRSRSAREEFSRSRSLQRASRRARAMESNAKGSHSLPQSSPSSSDLTRLGDPLMTKSHRSGHKVIFPVTNVPKPGELATLIGLKGIGNVMTDIDAVAKKKKRPKFLAKQFRMLSNGSSGAAPRLNIKILGRDASDAKVVSVTEEMERDHNPRMHDRRTQKLKGEAPIESVTEYLPAHAIPNMRLDSLSRTPSMSRRSCSASERSSYSHGSSPRSVISNQSIPETVLSSTDHGNSRRFRVPSRTSVSSRGEWMSQDLDSFNDRHGELDIAGLSLGEGRNFGTVSQRTDISNADSPARSRPDTLDLNYSPDDTNSGVGMYHEMSSSGRGSYSSRHSSRNSVQDWTTEYEDSDYTRQYRGRHCRNDSSSSTTSSSPGARSRYSPALYRHERDLSPRAHRKLTRELSGSFNSRHRNGHHHHHRHHRHSKRDDSIGPASSHGLKDKRHNGSQPAVVSSKVVVLLGKYGNRKGLRLSRLQSGSQPAHSRNSSLLDDNTAVPLDSISPQEAVAVFQDEVARMMLEEGECDEVEDIEDFLDGYMRLSSPFYLEMVEEFFRAVCYDCYKRPLDLPVKPPPGSCHGGRPSFSRSSSLRSECRRPLKVH